MQTQRVQLVVQAVLADVCRGSNAQVSSKPGLVLLDVGNGERSTVELEAWSGRQAFCLIKPMLQASNATLKCPASVISQRAINKTAHLRPDDAYLVFEGV